VELNQEYCCWTLKRLRNAINDPVIQGYTDGIFWERNSLNEQPKTANDIQTNKQGMLL